MVQLPPLQQVSPSPLPSSIHLIDLYHSHHHTYSSLIPPSLIPPHYYKTESTPLYIHHSQIFNEQTRTWESDVFPKAMSNTRAEGYFLAQTFERMYNQVTTTA